MKLYRLHDKFTRILFSIALIFIIFSLAIISNIPPAKGYEFSIYDAYPWYFWLLIITSLFIGQLIIIKNAVSADWSNSWVFGFVTILITNVILLFLPIVRDYSIYGREDVLTHIGYAKDILSSGHIPTFNIYPIEHILAITIQGVTNIDLGTLTIVIPSILFLLFVFWYALFILQVFERKVAMFILPISALPLFGTSTILYVPHMLSFYFIPFVLYILSNAELKINQKYEYMTILFLAIMCMLFFHPITFLYLIAIILLFYAMKTASNKFHKEKKSYRHFFSIKSGFFLLGLIVTSYIIYSSNPVLKRRFEQLLSNFFGLNPLLYYYNNILQNFNIRIVDITKVLIGKFGTLFILAISSTILILYCLTKYFRKLRENNSTKETVKKLFSPSHRYLIFFVVSFIFFSTWSLVNMFIRFLYFYRAFKFITFFSVPLTGFLFYISNKKYKKAKFIFIGALVLLICISIISLFDSSHWGCEQNYQVSHGEYAGMHWFFEHRDTNLLIYEQGPSQFRFYDAIYGLTDAAHRKNISRSSSMRIPDHFGYYNDTGPVGQLYDKNTYFIISTAGKFFYENIYPQYKEYWRFTPSDYKKFENSDISANRIYADRELDTYFIIGSNSKIS